MWKIKQFGGGKEFLMRAELGLPSVRFVQAPRLDQISHKAYEPGIDFITGVMRNAEAV